MYEIIHTKAIILLERQEKEFDKVFFIFSKELGLTSVTAPGILKPMAKLRSLILPFRVVDADIVVGKYSKKMTTVIEVHPFDQILYTEEKRILFLRVFEFIIAMLPRNIPASDIFEIFYTCIRQLETNTVLDLPELEVQTISKLLTVLGYEIDTLQSTHNALSLDKKFLHRLQTRLREI